MTRVMIFISAVLTLKIFTVSGKNTVKTFSNRMVQNYVVDSEQQIYDTVFLADFAINVA